MGVEDRVASRLRVPSAARRIRRNDHQERFARARHFLSALTVRSSLVRTTYERGNGKGKKAKTNKQTFWCIRADVVRKLDGSMRTGRAFIAQSARNGEEVFAALRITRWVVGKFGPACAQLVRGGALGAQPEMAVPHC